MRSAAYRSFMRRLTAANGEARAAFAASAGTRMRCERDGVNFCPMGFAAWEETGQALPPFLFDQAAKVVGLTLPETLAMQRAVDFDSPSDRRDPHVRVVRQELLAAVGLAPVIDEEMAEDTAVA